MTCVHDHLASGRWDRALAATELNACARGVALLGQGHVEEAAEAFGQAFVDAERDQDELLQALALCWGGGAHLLQGEARLGHRALRRAQAWRDISDPRVEALALILGAFSLVAELDEARRRDDTETLAFLARRLHEQDALIQSALGLRDDWNVAAAGHLYDQMTRPHRGAQARAETLGTLTILGEFKALRLGDEPPVSLARRRAIRGALRALIQAHAEGRGRRLSLEDLWLGGWNEPSEGLDKRRADRVYKMISTLRQLGLEPWLERDQTGYRLSPALLIQRQQEGPK